MYGVLYLNDPLIAPAGTGQVSSVEAGYDGRHTGENVLLFLVAGWPITPQIQVHLASQNGYLVVAELLIQHGADVNIRNKNQITPLHLASCLGQLEIVAHRTSITHIRLECRFAKWRKSHPITPSSTDRTSRCRDAATQFGRWCQHSQ